jgi:hypothetical protein
VKRCCTCHVAKPLDAFHRMAFSADGRQARCKECFAEQYRREGPALRAKVRARAEPLRALKIRRVTEHLTENPCVDCGERDLRTLDFDHRDPALKRLGVAQMVLGGWTWAAVAEEIAKCDVRCANCHRVRTAEAFGWWKQSAEQERRAVEAQAVQERFRAVLPPRRPTPHYS